MALDIRSILRNSEGRNYDLFQEHVNPQFTKVLRTIGFDRCYTRAEGPYLWDVQGTKYLDMIGKRLIEMKTRFEFIKDVRWRGLMVGIEFGRPSSLNLRSAWSLAHKLDKSLFPQATVIPLFDDHHIITQVAGHQLDVIKLLPPLIIDESDVQWFFDAFETVMVNLHKFPGPVWEVLGKIGKIALRSGRSHSMAASV